MSDWACGHEHHEQEQVEIILPGLYINTLCLLHREHVPCRKCQGEEDMIENLKTPEDTFAAIQALLNHLDRFEGWDFGFQPPEPFSDEEVGSYLLGRFNDDTGPWT